MIAFKGGKLSESGQRTGLGGRFHPLVRYLVHGPIDAAANPHRLLHFAAHNLPARSPETAAWLLSTCAEHTRPDIDRPVYHIGASAAPGEELTPAQWEQVAHWMLEELGLEDHEGAFFVHDDRGHQHLHIVMSRVAPDGQLFHPWKDYPKLRVAMRRAERIFGLQTVAEPSGHRQQPSLSDAAFREARRTQDEPLADAIQRRVLGDFLGADSWQDLETRIARHGLRLEPGQRGGGVVVWTDADERVSISKIDRRLSGPKLAKRFGESLREHRARAPEAPTQAEVVPIRRIDLDSPEARANELIHQLETERATFTEQEIRRFVKWQHDQADVVASVLADRRVERVGLDDAGRPLFTTAAYRQAEADLLDAANALSRRAHAALDANLVRIVVAERFAFLADEQRDAVLHATCASDLALIAGRAGSGKTALAQAIAEAYDLSGYRVQGAALGGKAAEGLGASTGIESRTLASLRHAWAKGQDRLDAKTVLLVDEAGMLGTRELAELLAIVEQAGAKVILVGDPEQIQAIEAGEAFAGLLERHRGARVDTIRRQRVDWMRQASHDLAEGRIGDAITAYDQHEAVHWSDDPTSATWDLVASYFDDVERAPDATRLVFASRNADVDAINDRIRARRKERGELGRAIRLGGRELAEGDLVVFTKNDHQGRCVRNVNESRETGVKNGTLGTLERATRDKIRVRLDDGRLVTFDPREYQHLRAGYAVTLHKGQGATVDRSFVLLDPHLDRHATYVAATRHRDHLELWADRQIFADVDAIGRVLSRRGPNDLLALASGPTGGAADALRTAIEREAAVQLDTLPGDPEDYDGLPDRFDLGDGFVTTNNYLDAELGVLSTAQRLADRTTVRLGVDDGTEGKPLGHAVTHAVDGPDLTVFEGDRDEVRALFQEIRDAYADTDRELIASAFTARAAGDLGEALGIESHTFAGLAVRTHRLGRRTVLLVDQAHLADTRTMGRLLQAVDEAGCRAIVIGDPNGFSPLGAGDGFRLVAEEVGATPLRPDIHDAGILDRLDELSTRGAIELRDDAIERIADLYADAPPNDRPMVLTHRRASANALNTAIRERRRPQLGRAIELGNRTFAEGDRVQFTASDLKGRAVRTVEGEVRPEKGAGVRSGALGTLEAVSDRDLRVRLDDGRLVAFDPRHFSAIDHGYALTTFRANGTRADNVIVLAEPSMDEASGLIALSSHRRSVRVVASTRDFPAGPSEGLDLLAEVFTRRRGKLLVRDLVDERHQRPRPRLQVPDDIPTLERHPIHRRRVDSQEPRTEAPESSDPVTATGFAIEKLRAFDHARDQLSQIEAARASLPFGGRTREIADALSAADSPDHTRALENAFEQSTRLDAQARRWLGDLDGTRDERVEAVFEASQSLGPDGFDKLPATYRALVRDLWEMTVVPIERAVEDLERAERDLRRELPEFDDDPARRDIYLQLAAQAALAVAPRPVRRVLGIALTLARLFRDTPRPLLRFVGPRPVRDAEQAMRRVADLTGSPVEPKASTPKPTFTQPPTKPIGLDPIHRLAQALRSGDASAASEMLPEAEAAERTRLAEQLPGLDRGERRDVRRLLNRLADAIVLRERIRSFDLPRELTPSNSTPEVLRRWDRRESLRSRVREDGLDSDRIVDELTEILRGRTFDLGRFLPRRPDTWKYFDEVKAVLDRLQQTRDRDLPRCSALWSASKKAGVPVPYERFRLDKKRLRWIAKLAPDLIASGIHQVLDSLRRKRKPTRSQQQARDRDGDWEL